MTAALSYSDVSFAYPVELSAGVSCPVLSNVNLEVEEGSFALVCGETGSGKTTLLSLAKPEVAPVGDLTGTVRVFGNDVRSLSVRESSQLVGYVFQNPDNQIVCDTVWHELAFALENLGCSQGEMRLRVAETATWLGIGPYFRSRCEELSGGQRAVVCLAGVLALRPRLLVLDEPLAMLDPLARREFMALLEAARRELGVSVVVATHEPAAYLHLATQVFLLEKGGVREVATRELPTASLSCGAPQSALSADKPAVKLDDVWFSYAKDAPWVMRGMDLRVAAGETHAFLGANGCGKSTLLSLVGGVIRPRRGKVNNSLASSQALLPQSVKAILSHETVAEELGEWLDPNRREAAVADTLARLGMESLASRHPLDLSGGQQQLIALEKLLLTRPKLLLLDEPSKGLDARYRELLAAELRDACSEGTTVLLATHDIALVRAVAHKVTLVFDGQAALSVPTEEFFASTWTYRDNAVLPTGEADHVR